MSELDAEGRRHRVQALRRRRRFDVAFGQLTVVNLHFFLLPTLWQCP
jgi:hypothetical protein